MTRDDFAFRNGPRALRDHDRLNRLFGRAIKTDDDRKWRRYYRRQEELRARVGGDMDKVSSI